MPRVLVTGGTGFTGSHLVNDLVQGGFSVRVLARSASRARNLLPPAVGIVEGDVADRAAVGRAVRGCEVVFNLAAAYREPGIPDRRYREVHVEGTRLLLDAAKAESVQRFVHCSTVGVHGHIPDPPADEQTPHRPGDIYQATKSEGERLALRFQREHDFPLAVARPTPIYGPGDLRLLKLFRMIQSGRYATLGSGEVYYHMVHVSDLVQGLRLLAQHPNAVGEAFIFGGAEYRSLNSLVGLIATTLGVRTPRLRLPAWPFQLAGSLCESLCRPLGIEPPIYRRRVDFFTKSRAFSIEKARRLLGYSPAVDLETGIAATAAWYRANGHLPRAGRGGVSVAREAVT